MTTHLALLRAINLAGHKPIAMADLRDFLTRLGFTDAQSLLQSGNLVFRGGSRTGARLEGFLEVEVTKRLGLETDFFVRTALEWRAVVSSNPFRAEAERDPGRLLVVVLKDAPAAADVRALQTAVTGREVVRVHGAHAYIVYPDGVGRSRLTHALIEKKLGTRGTGRNWNTVLKLAALLGT